MAKLIRQVAGDKLLDRREWRAVGVGCEAMVVYGDGGCSVNVICAQAGDVTPLVYRHAEGIADRLSQAIDSYSLEVAEGKLPELLRLLDAVCPPPNDGMQRTRE